MRVGVGGWMCAGADHRYHAKSSGSFLVIHEEDDSLLNVVLRGGLCFFRIVLMVNGWVGWVENIYPIRLCLDRPKKKCCDRGLPMPIVIPRAIFARTRSLSAILRSFCVGLAPLLSSIVTQWSSSSRRKVSGSFGTPLSSVVVVGSSVD